MRKVSGCVAFVWLIVLPALACAQTEIRVFVGGAVTAPVKEAGAAFAHNSGNTLVYVSDTTGALQKKLAAGERLIWWSSRLRAWRCCKRRIWSWRGAAWILRAH